MSTQLARNLAQLGIRPRPSGIIKFALDEGTDQNYEAALSNIAHAYIQDRCPEMLQYEVGFQLIERSDDRSKAFGIFAFKLGKLIIYVPVFYIDGKIYGTDMMYIFNSKSIVPLTEAWFNRIKKLQHAVVGEPIDALKIAKQLAYPNLMQLKPNTLKWAMMQPDWVRPFIPDYVEQKINPKIKVDLPVLEILEKSASARQFLIQFLDQNPKWVRPLYNWYGDRLRQVLKTAGKITPQYPDFLPKKPKKPEKVDLDRAMQPADVEFYVHIHSEAAHKLSASDLAKLREQGYLVLDSRKKKAVIRPKPNPIAKAVVNDPGSGFAHLLLRDLTVVCAYVVPIRHLGITWDYGRTSRTVRQPARFLVVPIYRTDENGNVLNRYSKRHGLILDSKSIVSVSQPADEKEHDFNMLPAALDYEANRRQRVCFFTEDVATEPITVSERNSKAHRGLVQFKGSVSVILDPEEHKLRMRMGFLDSDVARESRHLRNLSSERYSTYVLPTSARYAIVVEDTDGCPCDIEDNKKGSGKLALRASDFISIDEAINTLIKHAGVELRAVKIGNDMYALNNCPFQKIDALKTLVMDYQMDIADAEYILKWADARNEATFLVKLAQPQLFPGQPAPPSAPLIPTTPPMGQLGTQSIVTPMMGTVAVDTGIKGNVPNPVEPLQPTPQVDRLLQTALQTGQKEVFDTSMFASLMAAADDSDIVDKYIPDLLKGLAAVGHLRLNSFIHRRAFEDRFGKDDMEKLDRQLKETFHAIGQLVIDIQQKPALGGSVQLDRSLLGFE